MTGAAFFDLDRTLLGKASGQVFSDAMRVAGLIPRRMPGERLLYGLFNAVGENLPSMALARQAVVIARGKSQEVFDAVADAAAGPLVEMVQPFALALIEEHRAAGRPVVLATTTPYHLIKPFADKLGLDDVIATRYGVDDAGLFSGALDGPFVWSAGKLQAVRDWAEKFDVDLSHSYAYSDSVYDAPLLGAVGHPVAVNPDPRLQVMARARRWPVMHLDVPSGVSKIPFLGIEVQKLGLQFARPEFYPYVRFDIAGVENIPKKGAVILVANHRSYFDPMAMSLAIAKSGRTARFLGKKEVFDIPIVGQLAKAVGGIRVDRASGSSEPLEAAAAALAGGEMVALMPQGTIPRGPAFFDPVLRGRYGAARLAKLSHAPVIPLAMWGTEKVWPRSSRLPNMLNVTDPPKVRIRVGEPVELVYRSLKTDTERIMQAIADLLPPEAQEEYEPTDEELRRTYPPGYKGNPTGETDRRPGTDT